jgi:predicted permease
MLARLMAYIRGIVRRGAIEHEVDDELRFHLEQEIHAHLARGISASEARRMALRDLGGLTQTREAVRDIRAVWIDDAKQDLQYAFRTLRRAPGFVAVTILTLTLGIGANTAIFSVVNAVLLRPLPYRDPGSLVLLEASPMMLSPDWVLPSWRDRAKTAHDFAGFNGPRPAALIVSDNPETVDVADVTTNFFSFLGVPGTMGREFTEADASTANVAILDHGFWSRRFGRDPGILGRTIQLGETSLTVVGITGPAFRFPLTGALPGGAVRTRTQPDVFRVVKRDAGVNVIGRLAPGATTTAAGQDLLAIFKQVAADRYRQRVLDRIRVDVAPLQERLVGDVRQRLWLVMGAVGLVLLVACANVANLLLARASARRRELSVRSALGAGTGRLARLLISESLLLALIGSAGALVLAYWLRGVGRTFLAGTVPHVEAIGMDWLVLGFNMAVATISGILCGFASLPAITNIESGAVFNAGRMPGQPGRSRIRRTLLSAEVAVTFVLVVGAALLAQTLWNLNRKDTGFNAERLLTVRVSPGLPRGLDRSKAAPGQAYFARFFSDLVERIGRMPQVASVAAVSNVPLGGASMGLTALSIDGQPAAPPADDSTATSVASITPGYFRTMRTRVVAGREFDRGDRMGSPLVAVVNDAFRRRFAPGRDLVGSRVTYDEHVLTVVGIVEDVPDRSLRNDARPLLFMPLAQMAAGPFGWGQLTLVMRTQDEDPRAIAPAVRREIWAIDRTIVVDELSSMDERVSASVRTERHSAWLFGLFALVTLAIATIGVYGVAAYSIAQRTREIGIRVALGARRRDLSTLVISQTLSSILGGIGVGLIGSFLVTRTIASRLYGVTPLDATTLVGAALVLTSVAVIATYLPAHRAAGADPLAALRAE